jgi:hypothetical protein
MIHLCLTPADDKSLCGAIIADGDVLTHERPPYNREPKTLCQRCKTLYQEAKEKIQLEEAQRYEDWLLSLSPKEKRKMQLERTAHLWEDQMGIVGYFLTSVGTLGIAPMIVSFKKKWAAWRLAIEFPETLLPKPKFRCYECQMSLMDEAALANHTHPKSKPFNGFYCADCGCECEIAEELDKHYDEMGHGKYE